MNKLSLSFLCFIYFFTINYYSLSQNLELKKIKNENISFFSMFQLESNNLEHEFFNTILFGGNINQEIKNNWINSGSQTNKIHSNISHGISYRFSNPKTSFSITISDVNHLNAIFDDDLLKLVFQGNYHYQNQTLDISNTIFRGERFQGINFSNFHKIKPNIKIETGISYLHGNQHVSYLVNEGTFYTAPNGTSLDINFDLNSFRTNISDFSIINTNGNGAAINFGTYLNNYNNETFFFNVRDLGFIKWHNQSIVGNSDTNMNITGLEIHSFDNLMNYTDSIEEINLEKIYTEKNNGFNTFTKSNITLGYVKNVNNKYITNYGFSIIYKWHPYEFTKNISFSLFQKGLSESGFDPMIKFYSNFKYKGIILNTGISHGGYLDNYKIYFILSNKNQNISIGTYNIEGVFNNWKSLSTFLNLTTYF